MTSVPVEVMEQIILPGMYRTTKGSGPDKMASWRAGPAQQTSVYDSMTHSVEKRKAVDVAYLDISKKI